MTTQTPTNLSKFDAAKHHAETLMNITRCARPSGFGFIKVSGSLDLRRSYEQLMLRTCSEWENLNNQEKSDILDELLMHCHTDN